MSGKTIEQRQQEQVEYLRSIGVVFTDGPWHFPDAGPGEQGKHQTRSDYINEIGAGGYGGVGRNDK